MSGRRSGQAAREHLSEREYRAGQRAEADLCLDGDRHLGGYRRSRDQAVWVHGVLPGPGLGGHCIPIDPFYLTWKAREFDHNTRFIELAGEINSAMPGHVVERLAEVLNTVCKPLNGSRVLVLGLAYKPNVDDERESPSYRIMEMVKQRGADVAYHDPYVPVIRPTREHRQWAGTKSVSWDRATIAGFDAVVIATAHACINYQELGDWAELIVDTRNAMAAVPVAPGKVLEGLKTILADFTLRWALNRRNVDARGLFANHG